MKRRRLSLDLIDAAIIRKQSHQIMAERKLRRRKAKPLEEAIQFSLLRKDRTGLECTFINDIKGRGVFSCIEFDKGDFLLEYRGELISKEQCEQRQRIYHDALKVFMFDFRYNGKLLCVDAARDDGSLGRFVNDDHINPNSKMKTICVDGKPHLCLFALRAISPGEEITYDYGDAECPWRNTNITQKDQCLKNLKTLEKDTAAIKLMDVGNPSIVMDSSICEASEGVEKVTPVKEQSSLNDPDCAEKMLLVEEHVLTDEEHLGATERALEVCKHVVVTSALSSMDKCVECVGPVAALKWIGLRCKLCSSYWHKFCYSRHHKWKESPCMRSISRILMSVILRKVNQMMKRLLLELQETPVMLVFRRCPSRAPLKFPKKMKTSGKAIKCPGLKQKLLR